MRKRAVESSPTEEGIVVPELMVLADDWMLSGQLRNLSPHTLRERQYILGKLFWFIDREEYQSIGDRELKTFFLHLAYGHKEESGRFDNPNLKTPMRPVSLRGWHTVLRAWCRWMIAENYIDSDPMARVPKPSVQSEIKPPLSDEQAAKLLHAAKASPSANRDTAVILMLLDSGLRASELVGLRVKDIDLRNRSFKVIGKGNKTRHGFLGRVTTQALLRYLRAEKRQPNDYLFQSERGLCGGIGEPLKPNGLRHLIGRLAKRAGIEAQCSPHTLRRTFCVKFLRNGGNVFAAQNLMGHSTLDMTRKYCLLADTDLEAQHRAFSPADHLPRR